MTHHDALWAAIAVIASNNSKSASGLARACHLDATTFNPSKKYTVYAQARWISTETLAKVLISTNTSPMQFAEIFQKCLDMPE